MGEMKFIVPLYDLIVRDPESKQILHKDGEYKPFYGSGAARYWRRRHRFGSIAVFDSKEDYLRSIEKKKENKLISEEIELEKTSSLKESNEKGRENKFTRKKEEINNVN